MNFEWITHGGFEIIRDAWMFASNFFAAAETGGLYTVIFLWGLAFAAIAGQLSSISGKGDFLGYAKTMALAIFLYATLLTSSANIIIYDDVKNKTQTIGNIPVGVAAIAGIVNDMTDYIETIIKTVAAPPLPLEDEGYGLGIKMLQESQDGVLQAALASQIPEQVYRSAMSYAQDCLAIEAARTASVKESIESTTSQTIPWSAAANPALFVDTNLDSSGNPTDVTNNVTCQEGWNRLNKYLALTGPWGSVVNEFCESFSFDSGDPVSLNRCKTIHGNVISQWVVGGVGSEDFAKSIFLGRVWKDYLSSLDSSIELASLISYQRVSSQLGSAGLTAMEWMPTIKEVMAMVIILLTPLAALFLLTGFGVDAFKYIFGLYIFWSVWTCIDTAMTAMWMSRLNDVFYTVSNGTHLGTDGIERLWPLASKSLAMMGNTRAFGLLLSSAFVAGIFKWGGSALAHFGSGLARSLGIGATAGSNYLSPGSEGQAAAMTEAQRQTAAYHAAIMGGMQRMSLDYLSSGTATAKRWASGQSFDALANQGLTNAGLQAGLMGHGMPDVSNTLSGINRVAGQGGAYGAADVAAKEAMTQGATTNARYGAMSDQTGGVAADNLTPSALNPLVTGAVARAQQDLLNFGRLSDSTRQLFDSISSKSGGQGLLESALSRMTFTPTTEEQAANLRAAGIENASAGSLVTSAMDYSNGSLVPRKDMVESGSLATVHDKTESPTGQILLARNPLNPNEEGLFSVSGYMKQSGSFVSVNDATITNLATGQTSSGYTVEARFGVPEAAHQAMSGQAQEPISVQATAIGDKVGISGGFETHGTGGFMAVIRQIAAGNGPAEILAVKNNEEAVARADAFVNDLTRMVGSNYTNSLSADEAYQKIRQTSLGLASSLGMLGTGANTGISQMFRNQDQFKEGYNIQSGIDMYRVAAAKILSAEFLGERQKAAMLAGLYDSVVTDATTSKLDQMQGQLANFRNDTKPMSSEERQERNRHQVLGVHQGETEFKPLPGTSAENVINPQVKDALTTITSWGSPSVSASVPDTLVSAHSPVSIPASSGGWSNEDRVAAVATIMNRGGIQTNVNTPWGLPGAQRQEGSQYGLKE